jgi:hypothetical protein
MMQLFSVSSTLAGLSLTIATLFNILNKTAALASIADNIFAICAFMFICCNFLIFWTLRTQHAEWARKVMFVVDVVFLFSQALMLVAGFLIVWSSI